MKASPAWKRVFLVIALLLWLAVSYVLLMQICMSGFDLNLDFSLGTQLLRRAGIVLPKSRRPSFTRPMLYMLLGASGSSLILIILQFVTVHRRKYETITPQWLALARKLHILLGCVTTILLAMIGLCLELEGSSGAFAFVLSGLFALCLIWHGIRTRTAKH